MVMAVEIPQVTYSLFLFLEFIYPEQVFKVPVLCLSLPCLNKNLCVGYWKS